MPRPSDPPRESLLEPEQQHLADEAAYACERADADHRMWAYEFAKAGASVDLEYRVRLYQGYLVAMRRPTPFSTEFAYEIADRLGTIYDAHAHAIATRKAVADRADG